MSPFLISQLLTALAFLFDLASFQFKQRKFVLLCIFTSTALISLHFYLLNSLTSSLIMLLSSIRFLLAAFYKDKKLMYFFFLASTVTFFLTRITFSDIFPYLGSLIATWSVFQQNDKILRLGMMLGTSFYILNCVFVGTPGGIIVESFFLASNLVGYYRHYWHIKPASKNS